MTPVEPTTPLNFILEAQEYNQVMYWLGKHPYESVQPLIDKLRRQAHAQTAPMQPLANGADAHVRD